MACNVYHSHDCTLSVCVRTRVRERESAPKIIQPHAGQIVQIAEHANNSEVVLLDKRAKNYKVVFSSRKSLGFGTVTHFVVIRQLMSNHVTSP